MEIITRYLSSNNAISISILVLAMLLISRASSQITTPCSSFMSSFTPCFNFITGSTNGGGSPTEECCDALGSLITSSAECTCLVITGNVLVNIPFINNALAITLPRLCNSKSVPLQCKATATPLPGPGVGGFGHVSLRSNSSSTYSHSPASPVAYAPGLPPLPPFVNVSGSNALSPAESPSLSKIPASPPALADSPVINHQGQRPLILLPNSATKLTQFPSFAIFPMLVLGMILGKKI